MTASLPTAPAPLTHLLYLHGFRSSPASFKAQRMAQWVQAHRPDLVWHCPQLPPSPAEAIAGLHSAVAGWPAATSAVVGSSLGGFYATVVAEALGWTAVLLNPAVNPARDLARHIGEQTTWQNPEDRFFFREAFIDELRGMTPSTITRPERYLAVVAKGDEVLDWQEMVGRYPGARLKLLAAGDHALSDFDDHLPDILAHLRLAPSPIP